MVDIIQLLPETIANQIAAGEVVQRPASVVKELLENAVDAGGTSVKLIVEDAGKQLIQVIDNGCGMSETDARMCFERHATSKIKNINDLYNLYTFGFRGEALASIGAAAKVEIKTKRAGDEAGTRVVVESTRVASHEPCATVDGTSIAVKNLFFSIPARKNFLKANPVENKHITEEFIRVALAYPAIKFIYINDGEEFYHFNGGSLRQRILSVFGKKYDNLLVPVNEETPLVKINGFTGKPEAARKTRGEQFFFVNNRFIKSFYLHHSIQLAFEELMPADHHAFYVLFLQIPPQKIDVNVHPTKTEIKFEDEKALYAILRASIRKALSQYHVAPSLSFEKEDSVDPYLHNSSSPENSMKTTVPGLNTSFSPKVNRPGNSASKNEWQQLLDVLKTETSEKESGNLMQSDELFDEEEKQIEKEPVQLHKKYILSAIRSGLMIIHQQMAHERILYEKYMQALDQHKGLSQQQLFPEVIELPASDFSLMKEILPEIKALGFSIEVFGKNSFLVNGLPAEFTTTSEIQKIFDRMLEDFKRNEKIEKLEKRENLARIMARNAAIKNGTFLNRQQMSLLIDELFGCSMPYYSPDGKPTIITIPTTEIDRKFER